ncbi:MAG TPA: hypothetical protein VKZ79_17910 [Alphaproteobacteria bacterium]|nr:hypothetical protein [Alphaproteobacteria bacterium]
MYDLTDEAGWDAVERLSVRELRDLQLERLRGTLRRAYHGNPHYRAAFDRTGAAPSDVVRLDDLQKFPFTTKADLRASYPFGFLATRMSEVARIHASSGTTGKPTVVAYTRSLIH